MGYFDALASSSFKVTKTGKRAFYPWGRFGKGYELQTEEQYQSTQRFVIRYYMTVLPLGILAGILRHWIAIAILIPVAVLIYVVLVLRLVRGLPTTEERLTFKDSYEAQARRHSPAMLWAMFIASLLFVAMGIFLILGPGELLIGVFLAGFFGACGLVILWMLLARRRLMRQADPEKVRVFD